MSSHSPLYLHMNSAVMHHSRLQQAELVLTTLFDYVILALPGVDPGMSVPYGEDDIHYTTVTGKYVWFFVYFTSGYRYRSDKG